jgi:protoporphyrinogen oxidase
MRVAIVGAGFTGLAAGLELSRRGIGVTIFEQGDRVGGLAVGFRRPGWKWTVEKFYHHIFTNDKAIIKLSREMGLSPRWHRPATAVYYSKEEGRKKKEEGEFRQFDSAKNLLEFPRLGVIDKIRMGAVLGGCKFLSNGKFLEKWPAETALMKLMGQTGYELIWKPLLVGKFNDFADKVNLAWFWARIKKRTARLGTFPGGFQALAEKMADKIRENGGAIILNQKIDINKLTRKFDAVLSTLPETNAKVDYLDAHVLFLELKRQFLPDIYWLNILDRNFPFLVLGEHTNFVSANNFGGSYLLYAGNYLPQNHRLFSLSSNEVVKEFYPWLVKINPKFASQDIIAASVFRGAFAQPVMTVNYSKLIPEMKRRENLYVANQAMIYPWDRGTNYAVELGQKAAKLILNELK